jgi:hypothetical protein
MSIGLVLTRVAWALGVRARREVRNGVFPTTLVILLLGPMLVLVGARPLFLRG